MKKGGPSSDRLLVDTAIVPGRPRSGAGHRDSMAPEKTQVGGTRFVSVQSIDGTNPHLKIIGVHVVFFTFMRCGRWVQPSKYWWRVLVLLELARTHQGLAGIPRPQVLSRTSTGQGGLSSGERPTEGVFSKEVAQKNTWSGPTTTWCEQSKKRIPSPSMSFCDFLGGWVGGRAGGRADGWGPTTHPGAFWVSSFLPTCSWSPNIANTSSKCRKKNI